MLTKVNLAEKLAKVPELWSPRIVAQVDGVDVKVGRMQGEFVWHAHAHEDELFLVIEGEMTIELRDGEVTLGPGELLVVPKGVEHRPRARAECRFVLVEPGGIRHTGGVADPREVKSFEWI